MAGVLGPRSQRRCQFLVHRENLAVRPFREIAITISGKTISNFLDSSIFAWPVQAWSGAYYDDKVLLAGLCVAILGAAAFI